MRAFAIAPTLLLLAATTLAPQAAAAASGCSLANPSQDPVAAPFAVAPMSSFGSDCTVAGVVGDPGPLLPVQQGLRFTSGAPPCPPLPFVGPLPGELCGPLVPPLATVTCTATWGAGANVDDLRGLAIGLDYVVPLTADGNVFGASVAGVVDVDHEPLRHDGPSTETTFTVSITNALPLDARVIAYPVDGRWSYGGPVFVGCA